MDAVLVAPGTMLIGDPERFAIESQISCAYESLSQRALGYFALHIGGRRFGVVSPDATLLACSFDEVERRLEHRGQHHAPEGLDLPLAELVERAETALYGWPDEGADDGELDSLSSAIHRAHVLWAPDGDEAFDDSSRVLHFDEGERVRLIGWKASVVAGRCVNTEHAEMTLAATEFYEVLAEWHERFWWQWVRAKRR